MTIDVDAYASGVLTPERPLALTRQGQDPVTIAAPAEEDASADDNDDPTGRSRA